jgi:acyl carrier protein
MNDSQIFAKLTELLRDFFDDEDIEATPTLSAKDVDGWDSLAHVRLILAIERAFKVKFSTSEIGRVENVGELAMLIKQKTTA